MKEMTSKPREIFYLKDVLLPDTFANVINELNQPIWRFGRVTSPDTWDEDTTVFWTADLSITPWATDSAFYEILHALQTKYPETENYSFKLQSAVAGGKTFGLDGGIHTDKDINYNDMGDGYMTLCYFPNKDWDPDWGGEFQFFDDYGNIIASYYPVPNSCLVFDSNIPHRGLGPNRDCKKLRIYISYKTFVSKKWYLENNKDVKMIEVLGDVNTNSDVDKDNS
jgi:hypothetical protein